MGRMGMEVRIRRLYQRCEAVDEVVGGLVAVTLMILLFGHMKKLEARTLMGGGHWRETYHDVMISVLQWSSMVNDQDMP